MNRFNDLMGITIDTGDIWLDKKLNQNTAYILKEIAGGIVGGAILGKKSKVKTYGGGVDPLIKSQTDQILADARKAYEAGPREYDSFKRILGFDPLEEGGQERILALAEQDPDYFQTTVANVNEARQLARQAGADLTAEDIAAQRSILEGTAGAQKIAAERALRKGLGIVGEKAAMGGEGALQGIRADILRGGELGSYAQAMADIEGSLQSQAIRQAEQARARQSGASSALASLAGTEQAAGQQQFSEQLRRAELETDVGTSRRGLEQQRADFDYQQFLQADPFARLGEYSNLVYSTPLRETQYVQKPSGFQQALGTVTALAGAYKDFGGGGGGGAPVPAKTGGSLARLAEGGSFFDSLYNDKEKKELQEKFAADEAARMEGAISEDGTNRKFSTPDTGYRIPETIEEFQSQLNDKEQKTKMQQTYQQNVAAMESSPKQADKINKMDMKGGDYAKGKTKTFTISGSDAAAQSKAAQEMTNRIAKRRQRSGIGQFAVGGDINKEEESGIMSRIMGGVRSGLSSLREGSVDLMQQYNKVDPFRDYTPRQRMNIGLSILATQPTLGESTLGTIARGALAGTTQAQEEDLEKGKIKASLRKAQLSAAPDPFMVEPSQLNALRSSVAQKLGFVFDFDADEFKTSSGENLTASQAAEASNLLTKSAIALRDTEDLVEAQKVISDYN